MNFHGAQVFILFPLGPFGVHNYSPLVAGLTYMLGFMTAYMLFGKSTKNKLQDISEKATKDPTLSSLP